MTTCGKHGGLWGLLPLGQGCCSTQPTCKKALPPAAFTPHGPGALPVPLYGLEQLWGALRHRGDVGKTFGACHPHPVPAACRLRGHVGTELLWRLSRGSTRGFPFVGGREDHRKAGRPDDVLLRGTRSRLCSDVFGVRSAGEPPSGVAAIRFGDPLRADPRGFGGLGKASARKADVPPVSQISNSPLVQSVWDACSAVAKMCGCILLFAGFTAILRGSGIFQTAVQSLSATGLLGPRETAACLSFLLEVTGGTGDAAALGVAPVFYAFGVAFGGLCVHLQVFSFFREFPLSKRWFFLTRFLHGLGAAGIFLVLRRIFPGEAQWVWASSNAPLEPGITASTAAGGLSLLLMCLAFLVFVGRSLTNARKEPCAPLAPSQKDVV